MNQNKAKAEAEKIYLMFYLKLPFDKDVITENKHGKWTYNSEELAIEHSIIHVKGIIEALIEAIPELYELVSTASGTSSELVESEDVENWQSILTELNKM